MGKDPRSGTKAVNLDRDKRANASGYVDWAREEGTKSAHPRQVNDEGGRNTDIVHGQ